MQKHRKKKGTVPSKGTPLFGWRNLKLLIFFGLIFYFIYHAGIKTIENFRLAKNGKTALAVVIDRKDVGGAAAVNVTYRYKVNGIKYVSIQSNEPDEIGDTVSIVYLDSNPLISRTYRFIKDNYDTEITVIPENQ